MDKSVRFWTENLGFTAASVSPRSGKWQADVTGIAGASLLVAHLYGHGSHIELIQYLKGALEGAAPQPALCAAAHVCLEVDNIEETWAQLLAAGASAQGRIAPVIAPVPNACKAGYIRDPNGIIIELLELTNSA